MTGGCTGTARTHWSDVKVGGVNSRNVLSQIIEEMFYVDAEKVGREHLVRAHECESGEMFLRNGQALGKMPPLPG